MAASAFPARSVISSFRGMELALEEFAEVVPFAPEHADVWSPRLASVLLDTCSQLDSLWRYELSKIPGEPDNKLTMADYAKKFGGTRRGVPCRGIRHLLGWCRKRRGIRTLLGVVVPRRQALLVEGAHRSQAQSLAASQACDLSQHDERRRRPSDCDSPFETLH